MSPLSAALSRVFPARQVITDELRRLAYGTDASFYRMTPEVIAVIESENEVQALLQIARERQRPVTFRAAGTSLSGQAVTDSILALIGDGFATCEISHDALSVKLGPGMIGGEVNYRLLPYKRKIGPDPGSINACKIGGIAANNSSGMCCGTSQNTYHTMLGMRLILADGTLLDTLDPLSVESFRKSHASLLESLAHMGRATREDGPLAERIRHKYRIKNTTGYGLNALIDFEDPIDILSHLMIGSEGTLGFISSITYRTVAEEAFKASALIFFPSMELACQGAIQLKKAPVSAVELLDRAAMRSVQEKPGMPSSMKQLDDRAAALLVEVRAETKVALDLRVEAATEALLELETVEPVSFARDAATCEMYWNVRKGTFPSVGAMRRAGTTVIIEDVAFPIESLASATLDLQTLMQKHGYPEGIIFGHALEGNLHFVFPQDFSRQAEIDRYAQFMEEVCELVVDKYDGSLKAEHGTGRNVAPFVQREWGQKATELMRSIKRLLDPQYLLNPGVILNEDPKAHLKNLKPMPAAEAIVDRCIECGFCEPLCPSHRLTLSPRQRIVSWRELTRRKSDGIERSEVEDDFAYFGLDTCAGCGLCSTACPVGIDTGELTRLLRGRGMGSTTRKVNQWTVDNFDKLSTLSRGGLKMGHVAASVIGQNALKALSGGSWRSQMPQPGKDIAFNEVTGDPVVYFPTCGGRIFGANTPQEATLPEVILELLVRAGYAPRLPEGYEKHCCGLMLASKGMAKEADDMSSALTDALLKAADNGKGGYYPVIMDASSCTARMKKFMLDRLEVLDFHEFALQALLPRLQIQRKPGPIALHINCSVRRTGTDETLRELIRACADLIVEPSGVTCCGFGGDRGFTVPELNVHALRKIHGALSSGCSEGFSTNRTCEIGLTAETGRPYRSIAYLLEECSRQQLVNPAI